MRVERESRPDGRGALGAYGYGALNSSLVSNSQSNISRLGAAVLLVDGWAERSGPSGVWLPGSPFGNTAGDLPAETMDLLADTQRPARQQALTGELSGSRRGARCRRGR